MIEAGAKQEHRWGELSYGLGIQRSDEDGIVEQKFNHRTRGEKGCWNRSGELEEKAERIALEEFGL